MAAPLAAIRERTGLTCVQINGACMTDAKPDFRGGPQIRTIAMPRDANPSGDIFGGWVMSQMDVAGSIVAIERSCMRVATVGVDAMAFHSPVFIGDEVSCFARLVGEGRTSMTVLVETWVRRRRSREPRKVTEGRFTFVALGEDGRPHPLPPPGDQVMREV